MRYFCLTLLTLILSCAQPVWATMGRMPGYAVKSALTGKAAPDAVLSKSDGTTAAVIRSLHGKKAILVFWATWCPHCYEDLGLINSSLPSLKQKGIEVVLIDLAEARADVQKYFNQRQLKLTSFLDEDSALQESYELIGVPTLVFVDKKGTVRSVTHVFPPNYENYFGTNP